MITPSRVAATALALAAAMATGAASPTEQPGNHWAPDLRTGERSGIVVDAGGARLDPAAHPASRAEWLGLLTLPVHAVDTTDRVESAVTGDVPSGSTATVDVRGRTATGWSEWLPAENGAVTLPEPTSQVQGRLVLTGSATQQPVVRAVDLTARPATRHRITVSQRPVLGYRVFATREGLVGGTTANGHVIGEDDLFVALPSRRALAPRGSGDYSVRVCTAGQGRRAVAAKRCAYAPVWDVGPWNTRDDYWNPRHRRQEWKALPQGVPQAQVAHLEGFNKGRDQYDREVLNPAGIDLSDAVFRDVLGLKDNSWVAVDYLWTGSDPLATVTADEPVQVRAAPDGGAAVVGTAAGRAQVPVSCVAGGGRWLRIGDGQYVSAAAARAPKGSPTCSGAEAAPVEPVIETVPEVVPEVVPDGGDAAPAQPAPDLAGIEAEIEAATAEAERAIRDAGGLE